MRKAWVLFGLLALSLNPGFAQQSDSIQLWQETFIDGRVPGPQRMQAFHAFKTWLGHALKQEGSFTHPPKPLPKVSVLTPTDESFRLYTWLYLSEDGFKAAGFVQHAPKSEGQAPRVFALEDQGLDHRSFSYRSFNDDKWPGMIYYELLEAKDGKEPYYVLLGFHPGDGIVQHKGIETMYFNGNGSPKFGKRIIEHEEKLKGRLLFHYSVQATMSMRYEEEKKRIVFDHLSPAEPNLKSQHQFYGPDGSYDALVFKKDRWILLSDVDVRSPDEENGKAGEIRIMGPHIPKQRPLPDSLKSGK